MLSCLAKPLDFSAGHSLGPRAPVGSATEICQRTELRSSAYRKMNSGALRVHGSHRHGCARKPKSAKEQELRSSVYRKINSGMFREHSSRQRAPPGAKAATRICRCFTDTVLQAPQLPSQRAARPQHHWLSHCTGNGTNSIAQQPVLTGSFQTLRLLSSEPGIPVGTPLYCPTDPESHIYPYGLPTERGETFTTIGSSYTCSSREE